jgi:hypothetical protein
MIKQGINIVDSFATIAQREDSSFSFPSINCSLKESRIVIPLQ